MIKEFFILGDQETEYRSLVKVKTRTPEDKAAIFLASYYKEYPAAIDYIKDVSMSEIILTRKTDLRKIKQQRPIPPQEWTNNWGPVDIGADDLSPDEVETPLLPQVAKRTGSKDRPAAVNPRDILNMSAIAPGIARRFSDGSESEPAQRPKDPRKTPEEDPLVPLTMPATPPEAEELTFNGPPVEEVAPFAAGVEWSEVPELDELLSLFSEERQKRAREEIEDECIEEWFPDPLHKKQRTE
jgi:hypothetical protein